jgi:hypothetical protein
MITLHEVKGRRNKFIEKFDSPSSLMVKMGFSLEETRRLIDVAAKTEDGQIPAESDLVTRKYFITFDGDYLSSLAVSTLLDNHGQLDDKEIARATGLTQDRVVKIRKAAMEKLKTADRLKEFAGLISELVDLRDDFHRYEIVENTEIKITVS